MKTKKVFLSLLSLMTIGSLAVGCVNNKASDSGKKEKPLIIYSNSASDGRGEWLKTKAAEAGFNLEIVQAGGGDLVNRIIAEKSNPIADVVFGLNQMNFETFKASDILAPFQPTWTYELPEGSSDKDNFFHPLVEQRILMIYNANLYSKETAPKDWTDLFEKKEFKGKYNLPMSLGGATNQAVVYGILNRYLDEKADLGVTKEGWDAIKAFYDNGYKIPEGEDANANLASGKVPISFTYSSGLAALEEKYGFKAGIVSPEIGVPTLAEQVGIIKKGTEKDISSAEKFVNWFGSAEIQGAWAEQFKTLPINKKALEKSSEQNKLIFKNTKKQDIDYTFIFKHMGDWVEKIELEIL